MNDIFWKFKIAAWVHDPAEKALILFHDKTGHESGTIKDLREELGLEDNFFDKRADWWAAAADRPNWPRDKEEKYQAWCQVDFGNDPVLIHPLTGREIDLKFLDITPEMIKAVSFDHFKDLIVSKEGEIDLNLTFLSFWRFAPESPAKDLGELWKVLPADTRVPDHSIWQHLDITSAFAGSFVNNETPALLAVSFGPVQGFISQARTTSDLWAGSHLLSMIAWEGIKIVCERFGPDSIVFPTLRGVPIVDLWLYEKHECFKKKFDSDEPDKHDKPEWLRLNPMQIRSLRRHCPTDSSPSSLPVG